MPDNPDRIIRAREMQKILGISRSTLRRWVVTGNFPSPIPLGPNVVGWKASTKDAWLANREHEQNAA